VWSCVRAGVCWRWGCLGLCGSKFNSWWSFTCMSADYVLLSVPVLPVCTCSVFVCAAFTHPRVWYPCSVAVS
jgi:hypothetical protein